MRAETITWVGGENDFALTLPLLEALQDRCGGDGVGLIFNRLSTGLHKTQDIIGTLSLGLEGGGMEKQDAIRKVRGLFEDHGLNALALPALAVLGVAMTGWPKEDDGTDAGSDDGSGEAGVETPKTS